MKIMKVAIIGAGYTGMCIAKKLVENNVEVTIFDKDVKVGGMTQNIRLYNEITDKYYRHLFKSDVDLINLAKELNVEVKWFKSKMGYYINNKMYNWGQPIALLKFKPLSFWQKIKFGISTIKIKTIKDWKKLEKYTISDWFKKYNCTDIYNVVWKPLLQNKFGKYESSISMVWLWGKINLRHSEQGLTKETLGYIDFEEMNKKMQEHLENNNVKFRLNTSIVDIQKKECGGFKISTKSGVEKYDTIISTISYLDTRNLFKKFLTLEEEQQLLSTKYISAKTMIIETNKNLSEYYWLNIADEKFPFCGIIDYHVMENIETKNIFYISNYLESNSDMYKMSKEQLLEEYLPYIKKINKNFDKDDIVEFKVINEEYAQPIIEINYSERLLNNKLNEKGLYICTLPQIYPEDRGVNYAIKSAYELAENILSEMF